MQVQIGTKDVNTGEASMFTMVGSETGVCYFSWEVEGVIQTTFLDRMSAQMIAEALKRTANVPEKKSAK